MIAFTLFHNPLPIPGDWGLWLVFPMCLLVAIVYKTLRVNDLRRLPGAVAVLMLYMVGGLAVLGVGLWLVQAVFL
jgi:hypothetical protein